MKKSDKEIIKDLINLVHEQKEQINNIQNEFNNFKKEISFLLTFLRILYSGENY